jgi:hypothetical protein
MACANNNFSIELLKKSLNSHMLCIVQEDGVVTRGNFFPRFYSVLI